MALATGNAFISTGTRTPDSPSKPRATLHPHRLMSFPTSHSAQTPQHHSIDCPYQWQRHRKSNFLQQTVSRHRKRQWNSFNLPRVATIQEENSPCLHQLWPNLIRPLCLLRALTRSWMFKGHGSGGRTRTHLQAAEASLNQHPKPITGRLVVFLPNKQYLKFILQFSLCISVFQAKGQNFQQPQKGWKHLGGPRWTGQLCHSGDRGSLLIIAIATAVLWPLHTIPQFRMRIFSPYWMCSSPQSPPQPEQTKPRFARVCKGEG